MGKTKNDENNSSWLKFSRLDWIVILLIGIAYFFLISQYVNPVEDIEYAFMRDSLHKGTYHPVHSFSDAVISQCSDYFNKNGRVVVHTIVQYLCGNDFGKPIFFLLSTIAFMALIYEITVLARLYSGSRNVTDILISLFLVLVLAPTPGRTILGHIAFTANYLWSSVGMIFVIILFFLFRNKIEIKAWKGILICFFGFFAGSFHEGFSLPLSGFFFFYYCLNFKEFRGPILWLVAGFWLGTLFIVTAPSNFLRASDTTYLVGYGQSFLGKAATVTYGLLKNEIAIQLFVITWLFILFLRKKTAAFMSDCSIYFLTSFLAICFSVFIAYIGTHQLMPVAILEAVVLSCFICRWLNESKMARLIVGGMIVIFLIPSYATVYKYRSQLVEIWNELHENIRNTSKDYVNAGKLYHFDKNLNPIYRGYTQINSCVMHAYQKFYFCKLSNVFATNGKDPDKVTAMLPDEPEVIQNWCVTHSPTAENIWVKDGYLIVRIPKESDINQFSLDYTNCPTLKSKILMKLGLRKNNPTEFFVLESATPTYSINSFNYKFIYIPVNQIDELWLTKK